MVVVQTETRQQVNLQRSIASELDWVNSNAKGQQKKGKARLRRYEDLTQQVQPLQELPPAPPIFFPWNIVTQCVGRSPETQSCNTILKLLLLCKGMQIVMITISANVVHILQGIGVFIVLVGLKVTHL